VALTSKTQLHDLRRFVDVFGREEAMTCTGLCCSEGLNAKPCISVGLAGAAMRHPGPHFKDASILEWVSGPLQVLWSTHWYSRRVTPRTRFVFHGIYLLFSSQGINCTLCITAELICASDAGSKSSSAAVRKSKLSQENLDQYRG